jgi:hypothetical protein
MVDNKINENRSSHQVTLEIISHCFEIRAQRKKHTLSHMQSVNLLLAIECKEMRPCKSGGALQLKEFRIFTQK